ncbi:MAG: outer membrane beta-barrel protein [Ginsengibacter sp.]
MNQSYQKFVPDASITYNNNQVGEYRTNYKLSYNATSGYPTVNQIAPLVDSTNLYNIRLGNPSLKPFDKKNFSVSMDHSSSKSKAMFGYNVNLSAGYIDNSIVDSSIIDNLGRTTHYSVNANGNKFANIGASVNKAFKLSENQIQLNLRTNFGISENPNYVNSILNYSSNFNHSHGLDLYYTLKELLIINLAQNVSFFQSKQSGLNNRQFGNSTKTTTVSANYNFTIKISLSSNISYNTTSSTNAKNIDFTILNANLNYRFLKGNTGELKFSALDILQQNISVINTGNNNTLTTGVANVLQNYYMISFSYFPRQFGGGNSRQMRRR